MGLGKTLQALLTAAVFASEGSWPLLIVAPSALKCVAAWLQASPVELH
jgi:SNF2 family DNA or RNA helicase